MGGQGGIARGIVYAVSEEGMERIVRLGMRGQGDFDSRDSVDQVWSLDGQSV